MECKECAEKACHLCRRCITAHCVCGQNGGKKVCIESKACDCVTLRRCTRCFGCQTNKDGNTHCNCKHHENGDCLCASLQEANDPYQQEEDTARLKTMRRFGIPTKESHFKEQKDDFIDSREFSLLIQAKGLQSLRESSVDGLRGRSKEGYIASIERDPLTIGRSLVTPKTEMAVLDRALENAAYFDKIQATMPSEQLVDYVVHTSSLKSVEVPELLGMFESSAAAATAIVIEEYVKQELAAFVASNHEIVANTEEDIVWYIQELLNGATKSPFLAEEIATQVRHVFGKSAETYDIEALVAEQLQFAAPAEMEPSLEAWKADRIAEGVEEIANGALYSKDGIYVTLVAGKPSYWFFADVPDHGTITSEGYSSYQEAFSTKLELEARVKAYKSAERPQVPAAADKDEALEDADVHGRVVAKHHLQGMQVPGIVYFPEDKNIRDAVRRIALPKVATDSSILERQQKRLMKKLAHAREQTMDRIRLKKQKNESTLEWLQRCDDENRCPQCTEDADHMHTDANRPCLLWSHYQSKIDDAPDMSFLDCSIEWFSKPRAQTK